MSQPTFLNGGTTPHRSDSRWLRWVRILSSYQNLVGASPANNALRTDSLRTLKEKTLSSIAGEPIEGCCGGFFPQSPAISFDGEHMRADNLDFPEHPALFDPDLPRWEGAVSNSGEGDPTSNPSEWTAVDITQNEEDFATFENAVSGNQWGAVRVLIDGIYSQWAKLQNV